MNLPMQVVPLCGVFWQDGCIHLQATKPQVHAVLGEPYRVWENSFYYLKSELRIDFDENGLVKFIEFLGGIDGTLKPLIYGVSAFEAEADELAHLLKTHNGIDIDNDIDDLEHGYGYGFRTISVGIYRTQTPDGIEEMIEEAAEDGDELDEEELSFEQRKAMHWATLGIGIKNYYS